jgi:hypothetical protein
MGNILDRDPHHLVVYSEKMLFNGTVVPGPIPKNMGGSSVKRLDGNGGFATSIIFSQLVGPGILLKHSFPF